jgi:type I restriction-modification system DNA methylase subunit
MGNTKDGVLPPEFIEDIQKNINARKRPVRSVKRVADDSNWTQIKENVEILKVKCAEFSKRIEEADSVEEQKKLAEVAKEIRQEWLEIKAMMDEDI